MFRLVTAAVSALLAYSAARAAERPPIEVFGRLPAVEHVSISPTGDRVAYVVVNGEQRRVVVQDLAGELLAAANVGTTKARGTTWAGGQHVLVFTSETELVEGVAGKGEFFLVTSLNVPRKSLAQLLERTDRPTLKAIMGQPVVIDPLGKPSVLAPTVSLEGGYTLDLYSINLDSGVAKLNAHGSSDTVDWLITPNGGVLAREEYASESGRWRLMAKQGGGWKELMAVQAPLDGPSLSGVGRDGASLVVSVPGEKARQLIEVSLSDGRRTPVSDGRPLREVYFDDFTGRLTALAYAGTDADLTFFDPRFEAAWKLAAKPFPDQEVQVISATPDYSKIVVFVTGPENPGAYYVADVAAKRLKAVGRAYPDLKPAQIGEMRQVRYKAADGLEIEGFLTLPPGREAKGLPLVVLPHGGPASHDEEVFDWWAQAFASRGYAVLQPNFRGSTGRGREFMEAGYGQWGRKMQTDLSDGIRQLAKTGMVDPKRVCIAGGSYGGYAALAGVTIDRGVYRCAISVNGVADLPKMLTRITIRRGKKNETIRYWTRFMGAESPDDRVLASLSPARLAHLADAPVLLIHGRDDTVVAFEQSQIMADALKRSGKPVQLVTLPGEDHWLSREATRIGMLREAVAFLETHNPPD